MITDLLNRKQKEKLIIRHLVKEDVLFHENEICEHIGIVAKGLIHIVSYLDDGKEIIYNILSDDEIFGNNLIFSSDKHYKGNIIAKSDSDIILIRKEDLLDILGSNREFMIEYLNKQSDFTKKLNNTIKLLSIDNARERFMFYMHTNHGTVHYESISKLARQLFLQRETLSRLINKLEADNIIYRTSNTISMYNQ